MISNIDIQSIEPVDQQMRDSLSKSVQMAIEISTRYSNSWWSEFNTGHSVREGTIDDLKHTGSGGMVTQEPFLKM